MRVTIILCTAWMAVSVLSGCDLAEAVRSAAPPKTMDPGEPATAADQTIATLEPMPRPGIKPKPSIRPVNPNTLIGKSQPEAEALLGTPDRVQVAAPATIWRYRVAGCALDIFFYMDLGSNSLRALAYDAKLDDPTSNEDAIARCVGRVQVTRSDRSR